MRVIIDGSDANPINEIVITTFLNGLYVEYDKKLNIAHRGDGHVSEIAQKWISRKNVRSFDASWLLSGAFNDPNHINDFGEMKDQAYIFIEDYNPELIFIFNGSSLDYKRVSRNYNIPYFCVEKND